MVQARRSSWPSANELESMPVGLQALVSPLLVCAACCSIYLGICDIMAGHKDTRQTSTALCSSGCRVGLYVQGRGMERLGAGGGNHC